MRFVGDKYGLPGLGRGRLCRGMQRSWKSIVFLAVAAALATPSFGQDLDSFREKKLALTSDTIRLDSLSIAPLTFSVEGCPQIEDSGYRLMPASARFVLHGKPPCDSAVFRYRVLPVLLSDTLFRRSKSIIAPDEATLTDRYRRPASKVEDDIFDFEGITKSGSISRGIGFGNNQDLTVNSNLSLELSGKLTENMNILASISDDNIPIQPDGSTAQLQEFDQVFIKVYNERYDLIAGDFILTRPESHFMTYYKRAQGLKAHGVFYPWESGDDVDTTKSTSVEAQVSGAISKGKFARNIIQGVEGNQGPYRLRGNDNEAFIVVIAGTEKVYIDGRALQRGQANDYVIDYNTAEITFTANQRITKDRRIVVEFQYTDLNYARTLIQGSGKVDKGRFSLVVNGYSEQDSKNQPLQQDITDAEERVLAEAGDNLDEAIVSSIDSVEFSNDRVLYSFTDSLGYDSVLVYNTNSDVTSYAVTFSNVGPGNGSYVAESFNASGRIFRWVAPDTLDGQIILNGEYAPVKVLAAPKKKQMMTIAGRYEVDDRSIVTTEAAFSNYDQNTFSDLDQSDNVGVGVTFTGRHRFDISKDTIAPWQIEVSGFGEYRGENFEEIERYRSVEFDRDWNFRGLTLQGDQVLTSASAALRNSRNGKAGYAFESFNAGNNYRAVRHRVFSDLDFEGLSVDFDGSALQTSGLVESRFVRHISKVEKELWRFKIGYRDDREENRRFSGDTLRTTSYRFYDWQFYLASLDTASLQYRIFYRQRIDWRPTGNNLDMAAIAHEYGGSMDVLNNPANRLKITASQRTLEITDDEIIDDTPERSLLGRVDHSLRIKKGLLSISTFYELGSGLERRREFIYVEDPTGQGSYTWIDYNDNGVKELNEFEIARPEDGDRYIRVFTPTDEYVQVFSNQFSQSLNINPGRVWSNKEGLKKFIGRFSNQTAFRTQRKTSADEGNERFNPFLLETDDSLLVSQSTSLRNTVFFNRTSSKYGADYSFSIQDQLVPLTSGFEDRLTRANSLRLRWNLTPVYSIVSEGEIGQVSSFSDVIEGRNYDIDYEKIGPTFSYQPNTSLKISLTGELTYKNNSDEYGGETAVIRDAGMEFRFNKIQEGSIEARFNYISIEYDGSGNNSLAYEMLNGLQNGVNATWGVNIQRNLGDHLQLNLSYNGRKSEDADAVHQGNVQVRAFF